MIYVLLWSVLCVEQFQSFHLVYLENVWITTCLTFFASAEIIMNILKRPSPKRKIAVKNVAKATTPPASPRVSSTPKSTAHPDLDISKLDISSSPKMNDQRSVYAKSISSRASLGFARPKSVLSPSRFDSRFWQSNLSWVQLFCLSLQDIKDKKDI